MLGRYMTGEYNLRRRPQGCLIAVILFALPVATAAQTTPTAMKSSSLLISSQRPLLEALRAVASAVPVPVSFEEIPYENSADLLQIKGGQKRYSEGDSSRGKF